MATTFYSSHNELYFYVAWAAVIAVAWAGSSRKQEMVGSGAPARDLTNATTRR